MTIESQLFHTVSAVMGGIDDWRVVGVFSLESDAENHRKMIQRRADCMAAECVEMPMEQVMDELVKDRVEALHGLDVRKYGLILNQQAE